MFLDIWYFGDAILLIVTKKYDVLVMDGFAKTTSVILTFGDDIIWQLDGLLKSYSVKW